MGVSTLPLPPRARRSAQWRWAAPAASLRRQSRRRGWEEGDRKRGPPRRSEACVRLALAAPLRSLAGCQAARANPSFRHRHRTVRDLSPSAGLSTPGMRISPVAGCVRKASPPVSPSISTPRPAGPSSWRWAASASWCRVPKPPPPVPSWRIRSAAFSKPACLRKTWQLRPCAALPAVPATSPPDALVRCCRCWACWPFSAPSSRCGSIAAAAGSADTPGCIEPSTPSVPPASNATPAPSDAVLARPSLPTLPWPTDTSMDSSPRVAELEKPRYPGASTLPFRALPHRCRVGTAPALPDNPRTPLQ